MSALIIDGGHVTTDETFEVTDPSTGEVFATAPSCSAEQLDAAMASAARAQPRWQSDEPMRRELMLKLGSTIIAAADELTELLSAETGKPLSVAGSEPAICDVWLQYYAAMDIPRDVVQDDDSALIEVAHRPLGVVAAITPWNFPLGLAMWKLAPALRAGNTVVLKPSPFTPLATLRLGELINEVLPAGRGERRDRGRRPRRGDDRPPCAPQGQLHRLGPRRSGRRRVAAAADLKRVTLELGGNDPAILLDDVDVATVAARVVGLAFFNTGQACALPKRIYVDDRIYDDVVSACAAVAAGMSVGAAERTHRELGPLSTRPQFERVKELVGDARSHGASRGGRRRGRSTGPGYFFEPTILAEARDGVRIVDEEQFGPALPIICGSATSTTPSRRANAIDVRPLRVGVVGRRRSGGGQSPSGSSAGRRSSTPTRRCSRTCSSAAPSGAASASRTVSPACSASPNSRSSTAPGARRRRPVRDPLVTGGWWVAGPQTATGVCAGLTGRSCVHPSIAPLTVRSRCRSGRSADRAASSIPVRATAWPSDPR